MRISDWSSDVCSSDLPLPARLDAAAQQHQRRCRHRQGDQQRRQLEVFEQAGHAHSGAEDAAELGAGRDHSRTGAARSEEHTSELQSLMRISYDVFCLKKKTTSMT